MLTGIKQFLNQISSTCPKVNFDKQVTLRPANSGFIVVDDL